MFMWQADLTYDCLNSEILPYENKNENENYKVSLTPMWAKFNDFSTTQKKNIYSK